MWLSQDSTIQAYGKCVCKVNANYSNWFRILDVLFKIIHYKAHRNDFAMHGEKERLVYIPAAVYVYKVGKVCSSYVPGI